MLLIFISILISSYNTYLLKKYKANYQWISPCISTVTFIIGLWVVAKIFVVIDTELDISILASLAHVIETYLIVIFFVVILISYGLKLVTTPLDKNKTFYVLIKMNCYYCFTYFFIRFIVGITIDYFNGSIFIINS